MIGKCVRAPIETGAKGAEAAAVVHCASDLESGCKDRTKAGYAHLRIGRTQQVLGCRNASTINVKFTYGRVDVAMHYLPIGGMTGLLDGHRYIGLCLGQRDGHPHVKQPNRRFANYIQCAEALSEFFSRERRERLLCLVRQLHFPCIETVVGAGFFLFRNLVRIQKPLRLRKICPELNSIRFRCHPIFVSLFDTGLNLLKCFDRQSNPSFRCFDVSRTLGSFFMTTQRMRHCRRLVRGPSSRRGTSGACPGSQCGPEVFGQGGPPTKRHKRHEARNRKPYCDLRPTPAAQEFGNSGTPTAGHFFSERHLEKRGSL